MEKVRSCYESCKKNDVVAVRRALEDGFVVDSRDYSKDTLLHVSARLGCTEIVSLLLEYKADVNVQNMQGDTPLHLSVRYDPTEIISLLLEYKADVNIQNENGWTPLHSSVWRGYIKIVSLLLANKADVNIKCKGGFTPIDYTSDTELVTILLQHGAVPHKLGRRPIVFFFKLSETTTTTSSGKFTLTPVNEDENIKSASTSFSHTRKIEIKDEVTNTIRNDETTSDPAQIYENTDQHKIPGLETLSTSEECQALGSVIARDIQQVVTNRLKEFPSIKSRSQPSISTDVSTVQQTGATAVFINSTVNIYNEISGQFINVNGIQNVFKGSTEAITDDDDE